jgi:lipopolysaccharide transport system ATP-binding protein
MPGTVISVEHLSKAYRLGQIGTGTLSRDLQVWWAKTRGKPNPLLKIGQQDHRNRDGETIWALKDVSFEVKQGEVLGIIGRNGAGKSTLLKILTGVTAPTSGQIKAKGRVASLLEVGTGFHPELTGRENIYLNGAILGMKKAEIDRKFDEIVAFSEVEQFIDTPVKRYSSGMYVRLAFAVAAHLDPEILLVDEVLAVGDAAFQKKCLGKMEDVAKGGRTVLFVSHNMAAVNRLCRRTMILDGGRITLDAPATEATAMYLHSGSGTTAERVWADSRAAPGDGVARLKAVRVLSPNGSVAATVDIQEPVTLEMEYLNRKPDAQLTAALSFINDQGVILFVSPDWSESNWGAKPRPVGLYRSRCTIPGNTLAEGFVTVVAEVSTRHPTYEIHFLEHDSVGFQVVDNGEPGSVRAGWGRSIPGVVRPKLDWHNEYLGPNGLL